VFTRILRLPIAGVDHAGRVAVALALYARYAGDMDTEFFRHVLNMLTEEEREHWISVGLALRLAYSLSAGTADVLRRAQLNMTDSKLTLTLPRSSQVLYGEAVERRLEALGRALGRNVAVA
jgi:exopolyphosphatase/guanosine-5'-triphosphate,3'-diphosphate pyrophosphatase